MSRCIDADALKQNWLFRGDDGKPYRDVVDEQPTIEPERKTFSEMVHLHDGKPYTIEPERTGIGNNIGYADSVCPNCGRQRVEKYESGLEICEKCHWCIQTSNFWWWEVEHE